MSGYRYIVCGWSTGGQEETAGDWSLFGKFSESHQLGTEFL
jgi:hypothetical protein